MPPLPWIDLEVADHRLRVEVAASEAARARGLMWRDALDEDAGMLFVFSADGWLSFWMRDTRIPLSIAYLDAAGVIINLHDMTPFELRGYAAHAPARYALETNQGWFTARAITPGDRCRFTLPDDLTIDP